MNDVVTLKSLAALAIEHEADFEIYHGETTHQDKRVRAQMILSLSGCPAVRILFGDTKHGQRLSSISLDANTKVSVKKEDLLAALGNHRTTAHWRRVITPETPLFNINTAENNQISITGVMERIPSPFLIKPGTVAPYDYYTVRIANHVASVSNPAGIYETEPTIFEMAVSNTKHPDFREKWENGMTEATFVGDYQFPNLLKLNHIK